MRLGDGGCQCDNYCGYTCKGSCNNDEQCSWVENKVRNKKIKRKFDGVCVLDTTKLPTGPIKHCFPENAEYESPKEYEYELNDSYDDGD